MATRPSGTPEELAETTENLARILTRALRALGDAGEAREANVLGGKAWAALRHVDPDEAQRINAAMHYLAKLEGEGGVGRADVSDVPVVRVAQVRAVPGKQEQLLHAARSNAEDARAAGALSAEVCLDPSEEGVVVISRWAARSELEDFLSWHEAQAHEKMADYARSKPVATHYPLAR